MKFNKVESLTEELLMEDDFEQAVQKDIAQAETQLNTDGDVQLDTKEEEDEVRQALDSDFNTNKRLQRKGKNNFLSLLLVSRAGMGKSGRVKRWAKERGYNFVYRDVKTIKPEDFSGIYAAGDPDANGEQRAKNLPIGSFDSMHNEDTVLFLDEYNRANTAQRGTLLELCNSHYLPNSQKPNGQEYFENLVLVVCAINPADDDDNYAVNKMDAAELSRFDKFDIEPDKFDFLRYITKSLKADIEEDDEQERLEDEGRLEMATLILKNPEFDFDTAEEETLATEEQRGVTNYRSFEDLLQASNGTKEDLIKKWPRFCNKDKVGIVKKALANYVDKDVKGNDIFKKPVASIKTTSQEYKDLGNVFGW